MEDPGGSLDLAEHGFLERFRLPVVVREPGPSSGIARPCAGVTAVEVRDEEQLAVAEHVITAVFTPARLDPEMRGLVHPAWLLGFAGWRVRLGYRSGVPAGAAYSLDDGTSVGVHQVATLPEHLGNGVAHAVVSAILDGHRDLPATLTATQQGRGLYEQFGSATVAEARWRVPEPDAGPNG